MLFLSRRTKDFSVQIIKKTPKIIHKNQHSVRFHVPLTFPPLKISICEKQQPGKSLKDHSSSIPILPLVFLCSGFHPISYAKFYAHRAPTIRHGLGNAFFICSKGSAPNKANQKGPRKNVKNQNEN